MNMWGHRNEKLVLFTHDHTHQRSTGGADDISNTTTMCENCNCNKSIQEKKLSDALRPKVHTPRLR